MIPKKQPGTRTKKRNDFSESHYALPKQISMIDIDYFLGSWHDLGVIESTDNDARYTEYQTKFNGLEDADKFDDRRFNPVAILEYKYTFTDYVKKQFEMNVGTPVWASFMMAKRAKVRFFLVVATNGKSPYHFIEFSTKTGKRIRPDHVLNFEYTIDNKEIIRHFYKKVLKFY